MLRNIVSRVAGMGAGAARRGTRPGPTARPPAGGMGTRGGANGDIQRGGAQLVRGLMRRRRGI